jgi:histidinol-phosphatase (PHP family)
MNKTFYSALADYHMHTPLCGHAEGEPIEYARQAVELGLTEIGFSEHCPLDHSYDTLRMKVQDLPDYLSRIETARKAFPELTIRLGIEAEYVSKGMDDLEKFLDQADWDYVLGSVHYLNDWGFDWPEAVTRWNETRDVFAQWELYFALWKKAAQPKLFDSMAHPDLVKKFGFIPKQSCDNLFEDALRVVADLGIAIEINTAGLRKPVKEIYPSARFLQTAFRLGIPISLGSDAHAPAEVGMNFSEAVKLAKSCGYQEYVRFEKRKRKIYRLPK